MWSVGYSLLLTLNAIPQAAAADCASAPGGLVSWWPGDGNAADIASTNNGALQSGATASAPGLVGLAFGFDGTNAYVQIPDAPSLRPTNLTVECWVQFAGLDSAGSGGSPAGDQYLVFKQNTRDTDFEGFDLSKTRRAGGDVFRFLVSSASGQAVTLLSSTTVITGMWYHVAGVRGTNFVQLYVNGSLEQQTNVSFPQDYGNHPLYFGTSGQDAWNHRLKGSLDEVTLYNRALSPGEIASVYAAGSAGKCKAPDITGQPQSQAVVAGSDATFTVSATGFGVLTYQWQFDDLPLTGATTSTLALSNVQVYQAGSYNVVVSNTLGMVTSAVATLTVWLPPAITAQPASQTVMADTDVSFSAAAAGTSPLYYQWQKDGASLADGGRVSGASTAMLTIAAVQGSDAGNYSLVVTNAYGTATSSNASLTVIYPPCALVPANLVSWWPGEGSTADAAGGNNGTVAGYGTFGYAPGVVGQAFVSDGIHRDRVDMGNPTNLQLQDFTIEAWVKRASPTDISLDDDNQDGAVAGQGGIVFGYGRGGYGLGLLNDGHVFLSRIDVDNVMSSGLVVDTNWHHVAVTKVGTTTVFYIDGLPASGALSYSTTYTFDTSAAIGSRGDARGGTFWGMVDEPSVYSRALSSGEIFTLHAAGAAGKCLLPPGVLGQPTNTTAPAGLTATFTVTASGSPPLAYQWFFNGGPLTNDARISGATSNVLALAGLMETDGGNYSVRVTNAVGSATSSNAVLTIVPLLVTLQPTNTGVILTSNTTFSAVVAGVPPLFYQWQKDGQDLLDGPRISGSQSNTLAITGAQTNDAGSYQLIVTNTYGAVTSRVAALTVLVPPVFVLSPTNQSWIGGSSVTLLSLASGTGPLAYQWYLGSTALTDNARLSGTASNILSISNVLSSDAGSYSVVASNGAGSATSAVAVVTVIVPPAITTQPSGASVPAGFPFGLTAHASGTAPLAYQWQLNGMALPGATSNGLAIAALHLSDFGNYQVVVTNLGGAVTSAAAPLTLGPVAMWGYYSLAAYFPLWPVPGLSNVVAVAAGSGYSLALRSDGTVYAWGSNPVTNVPASLSGVVGIAAGLNHALAIRSNGTVVAWGVNTYGQTNVPATLSNVVAVGAGVYHSVAARADGTVVAWGGYPRSNSTNLPPGLIKVTALDAKWDQTLATRENGTVTGWGGTPTILVPPYLHDAVATALGSSSADTSLALLTNGTLAAWTQSGSATNLPPGLTNLVAVATSWGTGGQEPYPTDANLVVRSNGTVLAWSGASSPVTNLPAALSNVVAIAGGLDHALAIENDGTPLIVRPPVGGTFCSGADLVLRARAIGAAPLSFQWLKDGAPVPAATNQTLTVPAAQAGDAGAYQLLVTNALGAAQSIAVPVAIVDSPPFFLSQPVGGFAYYGTPFSVGASVVGSGPMQLTWLQNGALVAVNTNELAFSRALPQHGGAYQLIASNPFGSVTSSVARVTFSRLAAWGVGPNLTNPPCDLGSVLGAASGYYHVLAIQSNSTVAAWGTTIYGATNVPPGLNNVVAVSGGTYFSVALKGDGTVAAWGLASSGQTNVPAGLTNAVAVSAGASHALALRADGTVAAWGLNSSGQINVPTGLSNVVAIAAGYQHSLALKNDGTIAAWGNYGKIPAYTNAVAIAAGYQQSLLLQADGTVAAWNTAQLSAALPPGLTNIVAISAGGGWQGYLFNLAQHADGSLVAWGNDGNSQLAIPPDLLSAVTISAGGGSSLAFLNDRSPAITVPPWSRVVASGSNVTLRALAVGLPPLRYQWYCNGQLLPGATSNYLAFPNTHPTNSGAYQLVAMNDCGTVASAVATLTVTVPPVRLAPLSIGTTGFRFAFTSLARVLYIVEFKDNVAASAWTELERRFGVGGLEIVTDASAGGTARFYRVRALYAPSPGLGPVTRSGSTVNFTFPTVAGAVYVVQYKEHLEDAVWMEFSRQTGTGAPVAVSDPTPTVPSRFYRVRVE